MAKKKPDERSPKNKERTTPGFRTISFRVSDEYAAWLSEIAEIDRATIAAFMDRAATERAKVIAPENKPPKRIP